MLTPTRPSAGGVGFTQLPGHPRSGPRAVDVIQIPAGDLSPAAHRLLRRQLIGIATRAWALTTAGPATAPQ
jgi:hypothetical protein